MGRLDVDEMLDEISSSLFAEWAAFHSLRPSGSAVDDHRAGVVAAVIANVNRDRKRRPKPYRPDDFFPDRIPKPARELSPEEQARSIFGAAVVVEGDD